MSVSELLQKYSANKKSNYTWLAYNDILPNHISALLEIGVCEGGSMRAWCEFYPDASIFGIDIIAICAKCDVDRATILIGDVSDDKFMSIVVNQLPMLDVIIDDGSHKAKNQQDAFRILFPLLKEDGVYVIEDLHVADDLSRKSTGYPSTLDFLKDLPYNVEYHHEYTATIRRILQ